MRNIGVIGYKGMLGKAVLKELNKRGDTSFGILTDDIQISNLSHIPLDAVINCAGVIPLKERSQQRMIESNAILPGKLADICYGRGIPLLHVSTDCVFSGERINGFYTFEDTPDAKDVYGMSKALGERAMFDFGITPLVTAFRTSFIGFDHGLLPWLQGQEIAVGWQRASWSGSTVYEVARKLAELAEKAIVHHGLPMLPRICHLATRHPISKFMVLEIIKTALELDVTIIPAKDPYLNRALVANVELQPFDVAAIELRKYV